MRRLNLDQLQTLVTAAELGSLAAAARALHLSPPAVSLHIQELESRVGAPVLQRGRGPVRLTPAGELLVQDGRRLLDGCEQMIDKARKRGQGSAGTVRLATTAGVEPQLLPRLLDALERRVPGVDFRLDARSSQESLALLRAGSLDLAIVALPLDGGADLQLHPWRRDPMAAFVPAGWPVPARVRAPWLARQSWMAFGPPTQMHALIAGWFARAGVPLRPRFVLNQPDALLALVRAGHGAAVLPAFMAETDAAGGWVQVRPLEPPLHRELAIARRRGDTDALVATAFEALAAM